MTALKDREIRIDREHPEADVAHIVRGIVRQGLKAGRPRKESISLRVDSEVVRWFRAQGRGWQTRMNAVLKTYQEAAAQSRRLTPRSHGPVARGGRTGR